MLALGFGRAFPHRDRNVVGGKIGKAGFVADQPAAVFDGDQLVHGGGCALDDLLVIAQARFAEGHLIVGTFVPYAPFLPVFERLRASFSRFSS